jgi:hypothetical protein
MYIKQKLTLKQAKRIGKFLAKAIFLLNPAFYEGDSWYGFCAYWDINFWIDESNPDKPIYRASIYPVKDGFTQTYNKFYQVWKKELA